MCFSKHSFYCWNCVLILEYTIWRKMTANLENNIVLIIKYCHDVILATTLLRLPMCPVPRVIRNSRNSSQWRNSRSSILLTDEGGSSMEIISLKSSSVSFLMHPSNFCDPNNICREVASWMAMQISHMCRKHTNSFNKYCT